MHKVMSHNAQYSAMRALHNGPFGPRTPGGGTGAKNPTYASGDRTLAEDIRRLVDLLAPQPTHYDQPTDLVQTLVMRITTTLQRESNTLQYMREETAMSLVLCMQKMLDGTHPNHHDITADHRHLLRRLLVRVCRDTGTLPSSLFLSGVECPSLHSVAGGSFADIYQAQYGGERVALKRLRVFQADPKQREAQFKAFCREALVWRQLRHPHILAFLGVDVKTFEPSGLHCMVSPWMENGNIMDCVTKGDEQVDSWILDRWVYEIVDGLCYLHSERVVHGDLRGANILVDVNLSVKLSDFGLAKYADASTASWGTHTGGALRWMAPEILNGSSATFASDVYSFGCVCSEIYTRRHPFFHITNDAHVVVQIMRGARPDMPDVTGRFADTLRPLIHNCWNGAPSTRPLAGVLAETLRVSLVNNGREGSAGELAPADGLTGSIGLHTSGVATSGISTPVSYLRISSAEVPRPDMSKLSKPHMYPPVFRSLQPQPSVLASLSAPTSSSATLGGNSSQPEWQRPPRILIVDSVVAFRETGKEVLEKYGCVVELASDGAQAMACCDWNKTRFDLVFMRLNGTSATYLIRDYDRRIPIIALLSGTAKPQEALHNHYHHVGMNDVLPSMPSNTRLLGTILKYLFHLRKHAPPSLGQECEPGKAYGKRQRQVEHPNGVMKRAKAS